MTNDAIFDRTAQRTASPDFVRVWYRLESLMSGHPGCGALSARELTRLASILSRLASPFENERAIAGLLASAMVAKHGLIWSDLTALLQPRPKVSESFESPQPKGDRRRGSGKNWHGYCRRRRMPPNHDLNVLV
jgi:hypothetical protein